MASWPYNTTAWRRLRRAKLSETPLCEVCALRGRPVVAEAVDHRLAIKAGGQAFPPLAGLMSLCTSCHSWKTAHEDRPDRARKLGSAWKGCALDGGPIGADDG